MTKFQLILTGAFGFFILLAVIVFAFYKGGGGSDEATLTVWGDLPSEVMGNITASLAPNIDKTLTLNYVEKSATTIDAEFTEALASGAGPDIIITTQDRLWKNRSKLIPIPYQSIAERDFRENFVEGGELFMSAEGIYGLPMVVDPLVMYYNRDLLSSAGEARPIEYWDEIYELTSKLTRRDAAGNVVQSTIALGETRNINNFKQILSLLMLQAGTPITTFIGSDLRAVMADSFELPIAPGESALDFYTQFSNPTKTFYSWNRTLPEAQTNFAIGDTVYYLGFASELVALRNKNPNLNMGVTRVPQSRVAGRVITYGDTYAAAITRGSRNPNAALRGVLLLASKDMVEPISQALVLPPARRDILSVKQSDSVLTVFYEAALQSRGWRDPDSSATRVLLSEMVESVTSGRARTQEAINAANRKLETLINN